MHVEDRTRTKNYDVRSDIRGSVVQRAFEVLGFQQHDSSFDSVQVHRHTSADTWAWNQTTFNETATSWDPTKSDWQRFVSVHCHLNDVPMSAGGFLLFPWAEDFVTPSDSIPTEVRHFILYSNEFKIHSW